MPSAVQEVAQRRELFVRRRRVDAIHRRLVQPLQFLRGGDVGEHHEFLDQPMAVEPRPRRDAGHACRRRPAPPGVPAGRDRACRARCVPRARHGRRRRAERCGRSPAIMRLLHLLVGESRGAAHQPAAEPVRRLAALRVDAQFDEQAAAIFVRTQAAPAVRQRLRQHRHDAVGEVARCCRGCAPRGRAASRGARNARRRRSRRSGGSRRPSGSANTASSKSRASSPSIVTSGMSRRSVRRPSGTARARVRPRPAPASGNAVGMSCVWMAIRLTERASPMAPSRSMIRAGFRPRRWCGSGSASTISPSAAPPSWPAARSIRPWRADRWG